MVPLNSIVMVFYEDLRRLIAMAMAMAAAISANAYMPSSPDQRPAAAIEKSTINTV